MRISIHRKIFGLSLSGLVLCTLSLGGLALYFTNALLQKNSQGYLEGKLALEQQKILPLFISAEHYINSVSESILSDIPSIDLLKQDSLRDKVTAKINQYIRASLHNAENATAAYLRYNPEFTPPTSGIFITKNKHTGDFNNVPPTDFSKYDKNDIEHVGWYYEPIKSGKPIWMEPYLNKNIDIYMISYVIPLFISKQEAGVIGIDLDFHAIMKTVSSIRLYKTGHAFLKTTSNKVLSHPNLKPGETFYEPNSNRVLQSRLPNGMIFGIAIPEDEINEERYKLLGQIALFAIFLLIIFSFISALVAYSITKPILKLTVSANKLVNGDMKVDFTSETNDEIGDLSKSFQAAKVHLQEYLGQIQGLAFKDTLTGIRNKTAFEMFVKDFNARMTVGQLGPFGVLEFNINNLNHINETCGHDNGNAYIINSCKLICKTFSHSPVFRIDGDIFIAILQNSDLQKRDELISEFNKQMGATAMATKPCERLSIACGYSIKSESDMDFSAVQKRAEKEMLRIKKEMKINF